MKKNENIQWKFEQEPEFEASKRDWVIAILVLLTAIVCSNF